MTLSNFDILYDQAVYFGAYIFLFWLFVKTMSLFQKRTDPYFIY